MAVCTWLYKFWLGWFCYSKVCYDGLGCFKNKPPFHNANFELPQSPEEIQVAFLLYTADHSEDPQRLSANASDIETSHYNGSKRTIFIIHGYIGSSADDWILSAKDAILSEEDANVVLVDWEKGADDLINYNQAAANTRVVGALTAQLMTSLYTTTGAIYSNMYIVGYSLGAHIAGYAGDRIPSLGRITGLDPACNAFSKDKPQVRLDATDAEFVDIIHTDGKQMVSGFGIPDSIGDADYFPNGGLDQPACYSFWSFLRQSTCDHSMATKYFVESINSSCTFRAVPCKSWKKFERGKCTCDTDCGQMGFFQNDVKVNGNFYLETNTEEPFCKT